MITVGNTKNISITITNDVNSENVSDAKSAYSECDLYIDKKFEMPTNNITLLTERSNSITKINEQLDIIGKLAKDGKSKVFTNDTQYNNFKTKAYFWIRHIFMDVIHKLDNNNHPIVFIHNDKVSKHEWELIKLLSNVGVSFFIICKNIDELNGDNIKKDVYNTNENLNYKENKISNISNISEYNIINSTKNETVFNNTDEVEAALYENKTPMKLIVSGMQNYIDTSNFYGKLFKESQNSAEIKLCIGGFDKVPNEVLNSIPRLKIDKHDYIIDTILKFLNIKNVRIKESLDKAVRAEFNKEEYDSLTASIFFNKLVYVVCTLSEIFKNNEYKYIAYYGAVQKNDKIVFNVLSNVEAVSFLILTSDKSKVVQLDGVYTLELPISVELFDIPTVDTRQNAHTVAATAERKVNDTLFSGDTLGMYKPGQFRTCNAKLFTTTFDEIVLWWNKEMYLRPGFQPEGDSVTIPTIFKLIKGINESQAEYEKYIQSLTCGKTLLYKSSSELLNISTFNTQEYTKKNYQGIYIHRLTDINNTSFADQKPFFENGKLNRKRIQTSINYRYGFLSGTKQELILDKIEMLINSGFINESSFDNKEVFIDRILNILLNLDKNVLQYIQWFEYYTYSPNVVLVLNDETTVSINNIIVLLFLYLVGFDVLVFVPTCYTTIENLINNNFMYDIHTIGEACYTVNLSNIKVTDNIEVMQKEKKQGFFTKLFNR